MNHERYLPEPLPSRRSDDLDNFFHHMFRLNFDNLIR